MRRSVSLAVSTLLSFAGVASGQQRHSIDEIKQAWQRRQDDIRAVRMTWTEVHTLPKMFFDLLPGRADTKKPPTDLQLAGRGALTFDDHSLRLSVERRSWSVVHGKVMDLEEVNTYQGDRDTVLTIRSTVVDYPDAHISKKPKAGGAVEYTVWPAVCYARGRNPKFTPIELEEFNLTTNLSVADGRRCVELVRASRFHTSRELLLLDPARGFVLVRYSVTTDGRVTTRLDVRYASDPVRGWVPKSWDYAVSTPTGALVEANQVNVEAFGINPDLDANTFHLTLSSGTRVYDEYDGPAKQYVIRADGGPGTAVPDSAHPTYERLTELAEKGGRWVPQSRVAVIAGVAVLLSTVVTVWWWRRRPGQPPTRQFQHPGEPR
ncbi:MAG: hypothetical protein K2X87_23930 [Gemmataceae bacterium]|nr:hypothetical protein [Gemmataceae bacterium]